MSRLRIYGIARTRAFRALWIAKELGLDYEHIPVEIGPAGARQAGLPRDQSRTAGCRRSTTAASSCGSRWRSRSISPRSTDRRLYPATLEGEAKAWQWSLWSVQEVDRGVNIWSLHAVRLPPEDRDPQRLAEALKVLEPPFRVLDGALADRPYLLGDDFTVADLNVAGGDQPGDRHGPVGDAAHRRLAPALPRTSGGARRPAPAGGGRRRRFRSRSRARSPATIGCEPCCRPGPSAAPAS